MGVGWGGLLDERLFFYGNSDWNSLSVQSSTIQINTAILTVNSYFSFSLKYLKGIVVLYNTLEVKKMGWVWLWLHKVMG